jgi:hypothetical protein
MPVLARASSNLPKPNPPTPPKDTLNMGIALIADTLEILQDFRRSINESRSNSFLFGVETLSVLNLLLCTVLGVVWVRFKCS